jgi:hypothetical protein
MFNRDINPREKSLRDDYDGSITAKCNVVQGEIVFVNDEQLAFNFVDLVCDIQNHLAIVL